MVTCFLYEEILLLLQQEAATLKNLNEETVLFNVRRHFLQPYTFVNALVPV